MIASAVTTIFIQQAVLKRKEANTWQPYNTEITIDPDHKRVGQIIHYFHISSYYELV